MDAQSQQLKRRDDVVLSSLNVVIEGLVLAENLSSITPAKAVFSTVCVILTMIRVRSLLPYEDRLRTNKIHAGFHGQRSGLRRTWVGLLYRLYRPRSGVKREAVKRTQRFCTRGDQPVDDVS